MFPCVHTIELNRHLATLDKKDAIERAIEDRIAETIELGGKYDPLKPSNFIEGLAEVTDAELAVIAVLMRTGHYERAAKLLEAHIKSYWIKFSASKAEEYVEHSCHYCLGRGCHKCEEP